jgi:sulfur carrier protein ThiS
VVGNDEETVECAAETSLAKLLALLAEKYGQQFRALVLDATGKPQRSVLFLLDGEPLPTENAAECFLRENAELTILPAMSGGL